MNLTGPKTAKISNKGLQPTTHKPSAMHTESLATQQSGIVRGSKLNPDVRDKSMKKEIGIPTARPVFRRAGLLALAMLPGVLGSLGVIRLWLSIIPGNPHGSDIMPFVEPTIELIIQGGTLVIGILWALVLGFIGKDRLVRTIGIVTSFLPFPIGFITFNAILRVMNYHLI